MDTTLATHLGNVKNACWKFCLPVNTFDTATLEVSQLAFCGIRNDEFQILNPTRLTKQPSANTKIKIYQNYRKSVNCGARKLKR